MDQIETISKPEAVKRNSRQLRGRLAEDLANTAEPFDKEGYALLKFHGIYQGYDRDSATERKQRGDDKVWQLMVRVRIPGGRLTADQYLALDALADDHANGTLRVTTRQSIQFHGVLKPGLKAAMGDINRALLTTLAACGDVARTVTAAPAPIRDAVHNRLEADARLLGRELLPTTGAYHEIWVDGEKWNEAERGKEPADPLYGDRYLPRKFKTGVAIPEDNTIDVLTNDLGIVALWEDAPEGKRLTGYNFFLGGGHGMTHNNPKTYPRNASAVAFVEADDLVEAAKAVVKLHRDYGDRTNRRHARLKYVIAENGEEWARERLSEYLGKTLEPCRSMPPLAVPEHLGWHEQGDGRLYLGIPISSGRIEGALRAALREIVGKFGCDPILMPSQDIILSEIAPVDRFAVDAVLRRYGVRLVEDMVPAERWALACPALPTCGLALTEAERVRDGLVDEIVARLDRHGLKDERLSIRITGCPNGCARPYNGDIGIVGRLPGSYTIYVGGDFEGTRLNQPVAERLALDDLADALDPLFAVFAAERNAGEGFGDFCHRYGLESLRGIAAASRGRAKDAAD